MASTPLILLVDDHDDTREMYAAYIKFAGFRVISAMTAEQAIELVFAEHPALIVMDVALPMMSGTDAVGLLKANPASASIPVLLLSAHAMATERSAGLAAGADRYVAKPCLPNELVEHIRSLLTVAPSQGPPSTKDAA